MGEVNGCEPSLSCCESDKLYPTSSVVVRQAAAPGHFGVGSALCSRPTANIISIRVHLFEFDEFFPLWPSRLFCCGIHHFCSFCFCSAAGCGQGGSWAPPAAVQCVSVGSYSILLGARFECNRCWYNLIRCDGGGNTLFALATAAFDGNWHSSWALHKDKAATKSSQRNTDLYFKKKKKTRAVWNPRSVRRPLGAIATESFH